MTPCDGESLKKPIHLIDCRVILAVDARYPTMMIGISKHYHPLALKVHIQHCMSGTHLMNGNPVFPFTLINSGKLALYQSGFSQMLNRNGSNSFHQRIPIGYSLYLDYAPCTRKRIRLVVDSKTRATPENRRAAFHTRLLAYEVFYAEKLTVLSLKANRIMFSGTLT